MFSNWTARWGPVVALFSRSLHRDDWPIEPSINKTTCQCKLFVFVFCFYFVNWELVEAVRINHVLVIFNLNFYSLTPFPNDP